MMRVLRSSSPSTPQYRPVRKLNAPQSYTRFNISSEETACLPPVQTPERHVPAGADKPEHLVVDGLAPEGQLGQGQVPAAVAVLDHVTGLVDGLLHAAALFH